ncbi:hypothetical protein CCMSSC00406_0009396 [Pleurotus cornucopiae]|uniref:Uncharacterized protein n=1 Tax=Pleurotus cornucopiae TaxID=5321 RepID=A0ACB7IQ55_PLECO|nr:hypothetical protein CCMSSC00406_0009396 [Pleurotus cornucopiae]
MHPARYRARLFLDVCRVFILPSTVLSCILRIVRVDLGLFAFPIYPAFIVAWAVFKGITTNVAQAREAAQFDAKPIPRVQGKWPGNIDVLLRMMAAFKTSYVCDVYLQLFEEYQSTTLNTRILWCDTVSTMFTWCFIPLWGIFIPGRNLSISWISRWNLGWGSLGVGEFISGMGRFTGALERRDAGAIDQIADALSEPIGAYGPPHQTGIAWEIWWREHDLDLITRAHELRDMAIRSHRIRYLRRLRAPGRVLVFNRLFLCAADLRPFVYPLRRATWPSYRQTSHAQPTVLVRSSSGSAAEVDPTTRSSVPNSSQACPSITPHLLLLCVYPLRQAHYQP